MARRLLMIAMTAIIMLVLVAPSAHAHRRRSNGSFWTGVVVGGVIVYLAEKGRDKGRDHHYDRGESRYRRSPRYYDDDGYRYRSRRYYRYEERYEDVDHPRRDGRRDRDYR